MTPRAGDEREILMWNEVCLERAHTSHTHTHRNTHRNTDKPMQTYTQTDAKLPSYTPKHTTKWKLVNAGNSVGSN